MIRIGYTKTQKQEEINLALKDGKIKKAIVFYYREKPDYSFPVASEYVEWDEVILYRFFYRLLEEIEESYLLIVDEFMHVRTRNSCLTYNCLHHYMKQAGRKLVFQWLPLIEDPIDVMILFDFEDSPKTAKQKFSPEIVKRYDIRFIDRNYCLDVVTLPENRKNIAEYEAEKEKIFSSFTGKNPDIIPRQLSLFVGKFRKSAMRPELNYICRNRRIKLPNVFTYKDAPPDAVIFDPPERQLDLHEYLYHAERSGAIPFLSTGLKVDLYFQNRIAELNQKIGDLYAEIS